MVRMMCPQTRALDYVTQAPAADKPGVGVLFWPSSPYLVVEQRASFCPLFLAPPPPRKVPVESITELQFAQASLHLW